MLPISHHPPIIDSRLEPFGSACELDAFLAHEQSGIPGTAVTASSTLHTSKSATELAEAFASFVAMSSRLETAYRELQEDVCSLRLELADRNAALHASHAENERVRMALQQILDSLPCGVLVVTRVGELTTVNPEARRLLDLPDDCIPASLRELGERHGLDLRLWHLAGDHSPAEREICLHTPAGERWLHVLVRQICAESEATPGLTILILRDVTTHQRAERDREAARNAMVLAQVTSMLAHEIRNPLASLELFAQLIEEDEQGREEWTANLRAGIRQLSGTVDNVLRLHESGSLPLTPLRLADAVSTTVRFAQPLADQAEVSVQWRDVDCDLHILANQSALQQILLNLIRNAIRYTGPEGSIMLAVEKSGIRQVTLHCTDTGCGIAPDQIGRIFEAGFSGRGDSPGLGLTVCERLMKQHNGTISVLNVPHAGARFSLVFPFFEQEVSAA